MLKNILTPISCENCKLCCEFDEGSWEPPIMDQEYIDNILKISMPSLLPLIEPASAINRLAGESCEGAFRFKMQKDERGSYQCPAKTQSGCSLGKDKPYDCRFWPFRVLAYDDLLLLTISDFCGELFNRPLSQLIEFIDSDDFSNQIFNYVAQRPQTLHVYKKNLPVLAIRDSSLYFGKSE